METTDKDPGWAKRLGAERKAREAEAQARTALEDALLDALASAPDRRQVVDPVYWNWWQGPRRQALLAAGRDPDAVSGAPMKRVVPEQAYRQCECGMWIVGDGHDPDEHQQALDTEASRRQAARELASGR